MSRCQQRSKPVCVNTHNGVETLIYAGGSLVISPCNGPCLVSVVNQKSFSIQRLLGSNILSIFMNAFFVYLDANELGARQPFLGKWDPKIECRDVQQG